MYKPVTVFIGFAINMVAQQTASADLYPGFNDWYYSRRYGLDNSIICNERFERELQKNILDLMPHAILSEKKVILMTTYYLQTG